jgi:hypothetical protein
MMLAHHGSLPTTLLASKAKYKAVFIVQTDSSCYIVQPVLRLEGSTARPLQRVHIKAQRGVACIQDREGEGQGSVSPVLCGWNTYPHGGDAIIPMCNDKPPKLQLDDK